MLQKDGSYFKGNDRKDTEVEWIMGGSSEGWIGEKGDFFTPNRNKIEEKKHVLKNCIKKYI